MGWLALGSGLLGLSSGAYATFDILGKPDISARMQWVRLAIFAAVLVSVTLITRRIDAIAIWRLIVTAIFIPTLLFAVGRELKITPAAYLSALWRPAAAAGVMAAVLCLANAYFPPGNPRLVLDVLMGAVVFCAAAIFLWRITGRPLGPERDVLAIVTTRIGGMRA
jgi:hypothetical protein